MYRSLTKTYSTRRVFGACLLSLIMLMAPIGSMSSAAASEASGETSSPTTVGSPHSTKAQGNGDAEFRARMRSAALLPNVLPLLSLTVNDTTDNPDVAPDGICEDMNGRCTLRAAIQETNNIPGDHTISFSLAPNSTITLTGEPEEIKSNLIIDGPASRVTVSGDNLYRVFTVTSGTVSILNLTIANGQSNEGGGIFNLSNLTIRNSTFTGNHAFIEGGAIYSDAGTLTIINSTISGNSSDGNGGGLLHCGITTSVLTNVTIANNTADANNAGVGLGGGISNIGSESITLHNTIVANNFRGEIPNTFADDIDGPMDPASSYNLIGTGGSGGLTVMNENQVDVPDPGLGVLANNGGSTQTHRLLTGSPAIDKGKNFATDNTDQRGLLRPVDLADPPYPNAPFGDGSDIGAYELQDETAQSGTPSLIVNTSDDHDDGACTDLDCTLREAIIAANSDRDTSTITFDIPGAGPHIIQLGDPLDDLETNMNIQGPTNESVQVWGESIFDPYSIFTILDPVGPCPGCPVVPFPVVSISNLTISYGADFGFGGGGISNFGSLAINNSTFSYNLAEFGGAISNFGSLTINNSTFTDNLAAFGGAIDNVGELNIENSTFTRNHSFVEGGAIDNEFGNLIIVNSTISGNSSDEDGGGLGQCGCGLTTSVLTNVTITNNRADADGDGFGLGGGISNISSDLVTLRNTIVAGNFNGEDPSDIFGEIDPASSFNLIGDGMGMTGITNGTNGNQVGVANPGLGPLQDNGGPTLTHALLPGSPAFNAAIDMTSLNEDLDASEDEIDVVDASGIPNYGGFTIRIEDEEMVVIGISGDTLTVTRGTTPAAHLTGVGVNPRFDQRGPGFPRVVFSSVDIGAFEVQAGSPHHLSFNVQPSNTIAGATISPAVTVLILDPENNPTTSTANVTLSIGTNPGGGTLSGTTTVAAVNGTATFSDLSINNIGSGYTLTAGSADLIGTTSNPFNIISPASFSGTKTVSGVFTPGSTVTYTVVLSNAGPASQLDNPGHEFTDVLPSGLTLVSANATSGTAVSTTATNTVTWDGVIPANNSVTITITATINSATNGVTISNQGAISYDADGNGTNEASRMTDDPSVGGASDPTSFTVVSPANVSGTKTKAGGNTPGSTVTYTVVLSNGSSFAQLDNPGNEFTDVLPSSLTLVSASATSGTATPTIGTNTVSWNGSIAASGSVTITITATINNVPHGTTVSNQGTISYDADGNGTNEASRMTDDPAVGGASDPTSFTVVSQPDLTITKTHTGNFFQGQTGASYTIRVTNSSTGPTSGLVTVTDNVPVGLTATGPNGFVDGWSCSINGQTLTCTRSDVLVGGASYPDIILTVNVANPAPLSVTNTATVSGGGEVNTSNNTASDPTAIDCSQDFSLNNNSPLMISRFRMNGPAGPQDEFVEIYNPATTPHTVASGNCAGGGYGVYASAGNGNTSNTSGQVCFIPNGTVIPAGGYYLCTGVTYSLGNLGRNGGAAGATAVGDAPIGCGGLCTPDIPDDAGLALMNVAQGITLTFAGFSGGVLDAGFVLYDKVGFAPYGPGAPASTRPSLADNFCEGSACLQPVGDASVLGTCTDPSGSGLFPVVAVAPACYGQSGQYELLRRQTAFDANLGTLHQDTNNGAADFIFISPNPGTNTGLKITGISGVTAVLGAAGPYNSSAPPDAPSTKLTRAPFDGVNQFGPRNAERHYVQDLSVADPANNPLGTFTLRYRYTNNSGVPINGLRFEVDNLSTLCGAQTASPTLGTGNAKNVTGTPDCGTGSFTAILKVLNSATEVMVDSGGTAQTVNGTVMEDLSASATPTPPGAGPLSPRGGGVDNTLVVNPSGASGSVGNGVTGGTGNFGTTIGPADVLRVKFKFGVVRSGRFIVLIVPMAKTSATP